MSDLDTYFEKRFKDPAFARAVSVLSFGEALRRNREAAGLTPGRLGKRLRTTGAEITRMEEDPDSVPLDLVNRAADLLEHLCYGAGAALPAVPLPPPAQRPDWPAGHRPSLRSALQGYQKTTAHD